jgi:hypothetical protein
MLIVYAVPFPNSMTTRLSSKDDGSAFFTKSTPSIFLLVLPILTALKIPRVSGLLGIRPHCEYTFQGM